MAKSNESDNSNESAAQQVLNEPSKWGTDAIDSVMNLVNPFPSPSKSSSKESKEDESKKGDESSRRGK